MRNGRSTCAPISGLRIVSRRVLRVLAASVTIAVIAWFGWTGAQTRIETHSASQRAVRVAELRGTIAYLGEWMTMSAQMAASSGDPRWVQRYDEAAPKLDAAIVEASELATPAVRAELAETTEEAHRDLVTMERRAMALVADRDLPAARALLNGPEFEYLKGVYAAGIDVFGRDLRTLAETRAADLNDRAWLEAAGLGLSVVLLISTVLTARGHSLLQGALEQTAIVARTDALTDLPNRRRLYEMLETASADVARTSNSYALLLIDLDRFKAVNDAHGHLAGDRLLQLVATRLRQVLRSGDMIARLGGDEFAMLLRLNVAHPSQGSSEPALVAGRIIGVMAEPFAMEESGTVQIGASVGIAITRPGGDGVADLMHRADVALYRAKADGRGCFRFFEQGMDADARARALLESELRQAIAEDAIVPYFQPLVDLETERLVGAEMLARWPHPTRGMVPPVEFIPVAEEMGLIGVMTDNLLRQACRVAAAWPPHMTLACNISPLQLRDLGLPAMVRNVLEETAFPAARLELEVTESALVGDLTMARTLLEELKALGIRLALDDFGTGYSCLRHLQALPFDKLKIDASFVGAMTADGESGKIVSAVVGLGQSLGLTTVAEGVETEEMAALLRNLGCDVGQGWLFGRPMSATLMDRLANGEERLGSATRAAAA